METKEPEELSIVEVDDDYEEVEEPPTKKSKKEPYKRPPQVTAIERTLEAFAQLEKIIHSKCNDNKFVRFECLRILAEHDNDIDMIPLK